MYVRWGFCRRPPVSLGHIPTRGEEALGSAIVRHEQARPITIWVMSSACSHAAARPKESTISTTTSVAVVLVADPMQTEATAVAGFLAGYRNH